MELSQVQILTNITVFNTRRDNSESKNYIATINEELNVKIKHDEVW